MLATSAANVGLNQDTFGLRAGDAQLRQVTKESAAADKIRTVVDSRVKKLREKSQNMQRVLDIAAQDFAGVDRVLLTNTAKSIGSDSGNIAVEEARQIIPSTAFKDWAAVQSYVTNTAPSQIPPNIKQQLITIFELTKKSMDKQVQEDAAKALEQGYNSQRRFLPLTDPIVQSIAAEYDLEMAEDGNKGAAVGPRGSGVGDRVSGKTKRERVTDANMDEAKKLPAWIDEIQDPALKKQVSDGILAGKSAAAAEKSLRARKLIK